MAIPMNAKAHEAQDIIGYSDDQWHRFYVSRFNFEAGG
jgi:hypothetical protein